MKKFEVFFNIPSPYRLHLLRALWRELSARGIAFEAHFMARGHADRPDSWRNPKIDFPHRYWRDWGVGQRHFNPGLVWHAMCRRPDWLLVGSPYDTVTGVFSLLFSRCPNKIAGAEGNTKTPGVMTGFVGWFKRFVYARCAYASVPGQDAVRYFAMHQSHTRMKMPTPVIIPNLVDEARFMPRGKWPADRIAAARKRMGADGDDKLCIIPARFDPVKGLLPFFQTIDAEMLRGWKLVVMGHGPQKAEVLALVENRGLSSFLTVIESVPYDEMPLAYAASDLMLLPSIQDMNPLCVPEALFSGLPIALTDQAGNVEEGVTEGKNGWVLPVKDADRFSAVLRKVFAATAEELAEKGRWSLEHNAEFWRAGKAVRRYLDELGAFGG